MLLCISSVSVQKAFLKEAKKRHFEECNDAWVQNLKRKKDTSKNATNMGSVPVKKALSREVDKRPLRRMQRYMGSVSVHEALSKEVDKRSLRRMQRYMGSNAPNMDSVSVHKALSKKVDKRPLQLKSWLRLHAHCVFT
ncbi:hypothetical protein T4B_10436 [Trichinella pseudospiralis]|uniref:Uncharacterized protein n=1 Tax=Trichinella pseudospiralis TaxID=6337 RepID=A0A0V1HBQ3_TRIPS|nr:hypothetical protein T4B_10436 [Trichinella pseudospiralis]